MYNPLLNMGEQQSLEEFSEHVEYYERLSKRNFLSKSFFVTLIICFFAWIIESMLMTAEEYDALLTNNIIFTDNFKIFVIICFTNVVTTFYFLNSKRVNKAKEALDGNIIQLKHPRMEFQWMFTHLHPDDIEIGKIIHPEYSEKLESGDLVLLRNATCTNYSSSTEEYHWEMPRENYGYGGRGMESDRYGYGGYEDRYYSGTSTRTIHKAELKIFSNNIIFSCSQKMKKGDSMTLIAELRTFDEESKIQHLTIKKTLEIYESKSEE